MFSFSPSLSRGSIYICLRIAPCGDWNQLSICLTQNSHQSIRRRLLLPSAIAVTPLPRTQSMDVSEDNPKSISWSEKKKKCRFDSLLFIFIFIFCLIYLFIFSSRLLSFHPRRPTRCDATDARPAPFILTRGVPRPDRGRQMTLAILQRLLLYILPRVPVALTSRISFPLLCACYFSFNGLRTRFILKHMSRDSERLVQQCDRYSFQMWRHAACKINSLF